MTIPIDIPAGVVNQASKVRQSTNWREVHLIRWEQNTMYPVPGWNQTTAGPFASPVRKMHKWMTNAGIMCIAYLCESNIYADIGDGIIDITPTGGMAIPTGNNGGYGDDKYGKYKYGTARPGESRLRNYAPTYSMDNWGDELRAMTSADGRLLKWSPLTPATKAVAVTNAPVANRCFVVTQERHIMLFGMGGKMDQFGWCDQENDTAWDFTNIASKAGYYDLEPSTPIVAALKSATGIIMWTMQGTFTVNSIGLPYVYNYIEIPKCPLPIGPDSMARTPNGIMWQAVDGFWIFDGTRATPLVCGVADWIEERINTRATIFYGAAVHIAMKSEMWWFFASTENPKKNSHVVMYDYKMGVWSMGHLSRLCGFAYGNDNYPLMSDGIHIYQHEYGFSYPGESLPWAETFTFYAANGERLSTVNQLIPEIVGDYDCVDFQLIKKFDRSTDDEVYGPRRKLVKLGNIYRVEFRETARDFRLRVNSIEGSRWSIGPVLADIKARGKK